MQVSATVEEDIKQMKTNQMEQLNLFGLPLENYNRDTTKSARDMQQTI